MRAAPLALALLLAGCTAVEATTRVERGPLLRTFERPVLLPGGVGADVRAEWPWLKLTVVGHDVCRAQTVEEYAEERVTERTSTAAGPALSTGIANVLASAVLFGVSFAVSAQPNVQLIDAAGNYGPSTRQLLQGTSLVTLGVGVPAVVVGLIARLRSGEDVEALRAEQVTSQRDARCNERPVSGPMALVSAQGEAAPLQAVDGAVDVDGTTLALVPEALRFADQPVELTEEARARFDAWAACVALEQDRRPLAVLGEEALRGRAEQLHGCKRLRGAALDEAVRATDEALQRGRGGGAPGAAAPGPEVASFEEAVAAWRPALTLSATSPALAALDAPQALEGKAVLLEGVVGEAVAENIGVIQVGARQVFLFIPPRKAWGSFPVGTRVEAVALVAGAQTLGERTLPLLRAVWMRTAW